MDKATITLQNLTIGYRQKQNQKTVAEGLNASIENNELTCLLGANGVGKSTLLRTLATFQPALDGDVLIGDTPLSSLTDKQLSRTIGVVLTEKPDVKNMTAREMVALGRSPYTGFWGGCTEEDWKIVADSMEQVGITSLSQRMVNTLSDGERQKVMIAKALVQQTPVILLDEPTAFLDFPSKVEMMQLLRRLAHEMGKTIFMSTHDLELSLKLGDRLWLMEHGKLTTGTARQLADEGALSRFVDRKGIVFERETLNIRIEDC